jgi:hypothetical protein
MLILVQHLIDAGRFDRARVAELGRLLARFEAQPGPMFADPMVRAVAERIVHLKRALSSAIGEVRACSGCARGCVAPAGNLSSGRSGARVLPARASEAEPRAGQHFEGGRCCGTSTLEVFTQAEVRAMKLARVAPPSHPAEDGAERAGCAFRGAKGCSLSVEQRPMRCLEYVCHDLRMELEDTERFDRIQALRSELTATFARFEELTR